MIDAWFDGVCEPKNTGGHAAAGIVIFQDGIELIRAGRLIASGEGASNNVAEYAGMVAILKYITDRGLQGKITIHGDSKLVIEQLSGNWKVNGGLYLPYYKKAVALLAPLRDRVALVWVPRDENAICDDLSKDVLRKMGVKFKIQPEVVGKDAGHG